jgi:predicted HicB family RNase H-like nuclease
MTTAKTKNTARQAPPPKGPPKKLVGARMPVDLHRRLKIAAARTGVPMDAMIEDAVRQYLSRLEPEPTDG